MKKYIVLALSVFALSSCTKSEKLNIELDSVCEGLVCNSGIAEKTQVVENTLAAERVISSESKWLEPDENAGGITWDMGVDVGAGNEYATSSDYATTVLDNECPNNTCSETSNPTGFKYSDEGNYKVSVKGNFIINGESKYVSMSKEDMVSDNPLDGTVNIYQECSGLICTFVARHDGEVVTPSNNQKVKWDLDGVTTSGSANFLNNSILSSLGKTIKCSSNQCGDNTNPTSVVFPQGSNVSSAKIQVIVDIDGEQGTADEAFSGTLTDPSNDIQSLTLNTPFNRNDMSKISITLQKNGARCSESGGNLTCTKTNGNSSISFKFFGLQSGANAGNIDVSCGSGQSTYNAEINDRDYLVVPNGMLSGYTYASINFSTTNDAEKNFIYANAVSGSLADSAGNRLIFQNQFPADGNLYTTFTCVSDDIVGLLKVEES